MFAFLKMFGTVGEIVYKNTGSIPTEAVAASKVDHQKFEEYSVNVLDAAREQDYEAVWEAVNYVTESCTHCHRTYRDGPDSRQEPRCQ